MSGAAGASEAASAHGAYGAPGAHEVHGAPALPVACVSVSAALGGSERVLLEFAARAPAYGVAPTVVLPKEGPLGEELRAAGVPVAVALASERLLSLSQRSGSVAGSAGPLALGLRDWAKAIRAALPPGIRVLYSNGFKAHLACAAVRGTGARRVWHLHEFPPTKVGSVWRLLAGALPDATIAVSAAVADAWRLPLVAAPAVVLNGVDLDRFRPAPRTGWLHEAFGLPITARLIGMPAVFARWKGQLLVVEAFERAAARLPDIHLVIVGGPIYDTVAERGYAEELVRRVGRAIVAPGAPVAPGATGAPGVPGARTSAATRRAAITDRIHFLRFQPDPWRLYPEFDVVVHYSTRPEPFGRVVAEALACGTPALAARAGGPLEIVADGVSGWLVEPNEVPALTDAMVRAMSTDLAPLRSAARASAELHLSADRQAAEVARVLRAAAARG